LLAAPKVNLLVPPARSYRSGGMHFRRVRCVPPVGLGAIVIADQAIFTRRLSIARLRNPAPATFFRR
jgi:hypothetical protein